MPADYPSAIPDFAGEIGDQPGSTTSSPSLSGFAKHVRDELVALAVELGLNPSGVATSLVSRLAASDGELAAQKLTVSQLKLAVAALELTVNSAVLPGSAAAADYRRGVSLSGHEFGTSQLASGSWFYANNPGVLGTDFFLQPLTSWQYLASKGVDLVRLVLRWERLQPALYGPLSSVEASRISTQLDHAAAAGIKVILDIGNLGRYWQSSGSGTNGRIQRVFGGTGLANLPDDALSHLWGKLSERYSTHSALYGYGLMNEPHDFPDTIAAGGYTINTTRHTFDATAEGWGGGDGTVALDTAVKRDGTASLKATQTFAGTGYQQFRLDDGQGAANRTLTAQGLTVSGWVRIPAATPGNWFCQWRVYNSTFVDTAGAGSATVTAAEKDTWVQVVTTFTAAQLTDCRNLIMQINTDGGLPTAGTYSFNLDTVTQGIVDAGASTTGRQRWHRISQSCVSVIRARGDTSHLMVSGYQFGGVQDWLTLNGPDDWILDSVNRFRYQAGHFFDSDHGGTYGGGKDYSQTLADAVAAGHTAGANTDALHTRTRAELKIFSDWLTANGVRGYVGKVGWPNSADTTLWNALGARWYADADAARLDVTYHAAWPLNSSNIAVYDATTSGAALDRSRTPATIVEAHKTPTTTPDEVGTPTAPPTPPVTPAQGIVLGATVQNITLPSLATVVMTATAGDRDYTGVLFDVEVYKDGVKVAQDFRAGLNLTVNQVNQQTFNIAIPGAGAHKVSVGVFDQPPAGSVVWGTKRAFYDNIVTFEVAPAPVYIPTTPVGNNLYRAPQQVNNFVAVYPELQVMADQPAGLWLGDWSGNIQTAASTVIAAAGTRIAQFVIYNIPGRDNGNYSAGGLPNPAAYDAWINQLATGIGNGSTICLLEPDALGLSPALSQQARSERITMLRNAITRLKQQPNTKVYCDASMWISPQEMANMLAQVQPTSGPKLDGFCLNVSGYESLDSCKSWALQVSALSNNMHFVIDTSRNGRGGIGQWCNPPGRGLGKKPTNVTGIANCDWLLWIKAPGESDGECNGGPSAGTFWVPQAQELVRNAVF